MCVNFKMDFTVNELLVLNSHITVIALYYVTAGCQTFRLHPSELHFTE